MSTKPPSTPPPALLRAGFTLLETMIAMGLMALLFLGAVTLYVEATRISAKSGAQITAAQGAANGLQHVEGDIREAYDFALPEDGATFGSDLGTGYTPSAFQTTYTDPVTSLSRTIDTGIRLTYPASGTAAVYDSSGAQVTPAVTLYDSTAAGSILYVYRADLPASSSATPATPDASQGDCLWASGAEGGKAINQCLVRLSDGRQAAGGVSAANAVPNAVEFVRPSSVSYQVQIRLISSFYSPIGTGNSALSFQQTSEGSKLLLTGKCVLMRNHKTGS